MLLFVFLLISKLIYDGNLNLSHSLDPVLLSNIGDFLGGVLTPFALIGSLIYFSITYRSAVDEKNELQKQLWIRKNEEHLEKFSLLVRTNIDKFCQKELLFEWINESGDIIHGNEAYKELLHCLLKVKSNESTKDIMSITYKAIDRMCKKINNMYFMIEYLDIESEMRNIHFPYFTLMKTYLKNSLPDDYHRIIRIAYNIHIAGDWPHNGKIYDDFNRFMQNKGYYFEDSKFKELLNKLNKFEVE